MAGGEKLVDGLPPADPDDPNDCCGAPYDCDGLPCPCPGLVNDGAPYELDGRPPKLLCGDWRCWLKLPDGGGI